jgi:hypothetical protein
MIDVQFQGKDTYLLVITRGDYDMEAIRAVLYNRKEKTTNYS